MELLALFAARLVGGPAGRRAWCWRWPAWPSGRPCCSRSLPLLVVVWFLATGRWRAAMWSVVGMLGARRPDAADHRPRALARVPDRARQHGSTGIRQRRAGAGRLAGRGHRAAAGAWSSSWPRSWPIIWSARRQVEPASFGVAVAAATLVAPAVFHHYLAMLVLPMLLALVAASTPTGWVAIAYLVHVGRPAARARRPELDPQPGAAGPGGAAGAGRAADLGHRPRLDS